MLWDPYDLPTDVADAATRLAELAEKRADLDPLTRASLQNAAMGAGVGGLAGLGLGVANRKRSLLGSALGGAALGGLGAGGLTALGGLSKDPANPSKAVPGLLDQATATTPASDAIAARNAQQNAVRYSEGTTGERAIAKVTGNAPDPNNPHLTPEQAAFAKGDTPEHLAGEFVNQGLQGAKNIGGQVVDAAIQKGTDLVKATPGAVVKGLGATGNAGYDWAQSDPLLAGGSTAAGAGYAAIRDNRIMNAARWKQFEQGATDAVGQSNTGLQANYSAALAKPTTAARVQYIKDLAAHRQGTQPSRLGRVLFRQPPRGRLTYPDVTKAIARGAGTTPLPTVRQRLGWGAKNFAGGTAATLGGLSAIRAAHKGYYGTP